MAHSYGHLNFDKGVCKNHITEKTAWLTNVLVKLNSHVKKNETRPEGKPGMEVLGGNGKTPKSQA